MLTTTHSIARYRVLETLDVISAEYVCRPNIYQDVASTILDVSIAGSTTGVWKGLQDGRSNCLRDLRIGCPCAKWKRHSRGRLKIFGIQWSWLRDGILDRDGNRSESRAYRGTAITPVVAKANPPQRSRSHTLLTRTRLKEGVPQDPSHQLVTNSRRISEITRRAIIDHISQSGISWSGRLPEDEFLARIYNLEELPSTDHRLRGAAADIRQHRISWADWSDDWVFYDGRFGLLYGTDKIFLRFLVEVVHPIVRPNSDEARRLADDINVHLRVDGWSLAEADTISGRPTFEGRRIGDRYAAFEDPTGWDRVDRQIAEARVRLQSARTEEQYQAVGLLCREVLISVAQEVFDPTRHQTVDGVPAGKTDVMRMLEAFIATELGGGTNEEVRAHAKAALRLALALQHRRNADFRTAALCLEATASVTNLLAILGGRRG